MTVCAASAFEWVNSAVFVSVGRRQSQSLMHDTYRVAS